MTILDPLTDAEVAAFARALTDAALARIIRRAMTGRDSVVVSVSERLQRIDAAGFGWVFRAIALRYGTTLDEVLSRRRGHAALVGARREMCRVARAKGLSTPRVGALLGLDSSSVLTATSEARREAKNAVRRKGLAKTRPEVTEERRSA